MKAYLIQPEYSRDVSRADELFEKKLALLDSCPEGTDVVVLPEYSDVPVATSTREETLYYHRLFITPLLDKCREVAKRVGATVFVNALFELDGNYRNTTYVIDRHGETVGKYFKRHLPPLEDEVLGLDRDYTLSCSEPYTLLLDGVKYAFLTCYDFYFYEAFPMIARESPDVIIGCSLQRSDSHHAIETMCRFLAYNTNAYVLRSSVSFGEDSTVCGATMAVSSEGKVLGTMDGRFGALEVEFDPHKRYLKPAGFGRGYATHHEYVEWGRRPWQYRPAGSAVVMPDALMPYPRLCAHRGFSVIAPENTMPAYGAAVAMGAEEIELDLWPSADGVIVSCHDRSLERVSDGTGFVTDKTYEELSRLDFGSHFSPDYKGLGIVTFEEILKKFACLVIMNVHVKPLSLSDPYPEEYVERIVELVRRYDCEKHVYFMLETDVMIKQFKRYAPDIPVCVGHLASRPWEIVDRAIELGCEKVQLFKPYYNREMIEKAHENGIRCNVFWSDEVSETEELLSLGVDTVLTNNFNVISRAVKRIKEEKR